MTTRGQRIARYREITSILWDERLYEVVTHGGLGDHAPATRPSAGGGAGDEALEVRIRRAIERLGPAFINVGQILSTRPDLVWPALAEQLATLQDLVPPVQAGANVERIEQELGGPISERFTSFDEQPLASASIGQVHRAVLPDGRSVAVKVQRPGVVEAMELDLDILGRQARSAAAHSDLARRFDVAAVANDLIRVLRSELDYELEARNLDHFRTAFHDDPTVFVPAVIWDHSSPRVLTMELVDGIPGTQPGRLDGAGIDRRRLVMNGVNAYFRQIFELGTYHADPHAGNLFAMPDGRVGVVDFGRVDSISARHRDRAFDLILAVNDADALQATEVLLETVGAGDDVDVRAVQRSVEAMIDAYRATEAGGAGLDQVFESMFELIRRERLSMPHDLAILFVTLGTLEAVAVELDPSFRLTEAIEPLAQRLMPDRLGPEALVQMARRALIRHRRLFEEMPILVDHALRRAGDGEFRIAMRVADDEFSRRLERIGSRLSFALVLSALILGAALVATRADVPEELVVALEVVSLVAIAAVAWFFVAAIRGGSHRH
jgi:ubiquinone biosynthesis protein